MIRRIRLGSANGGNPLANALTLIVAALAVTAAIVLGFFAFIVFAGIVLLLAAVVGIRLWWFGRKLRRMQGETMRDGGKSDGIIEGEYRIVRTKNAEGREGEPR